MKKFILPITILALFSGCANKINLSDYRPTAVPTNELAPKNLLQHTQKKAVIIKFKPFSYKGIRLSNIATATLQTSLQQSNLIKISKVISQRELKDYIKLTEIEAEGGDNSENYAIQGNIENISYTSTYHPTQYIKIKHKTITIPSYWDYESCADIHINILKLPSLQNKYTNLSHACVSHRGGSFQSKQFNGFIIPKAVKKSVNDAVDQMKNFFAPKGYILRVKKDGDDYIIKISLGKNQGIKPGVSFNIYDLSKDPDTKEIIPHKIGTAKVGDNTIWKDFCWATVDLNDNESLKIGDLVKPTFEKSFFSF